MDPELKSAFQTLIEAQTRTENAIAVTQKTISTAISDLARTIARQAEAADTRMKRVEANLDDLVRIIKAEHTNGKTRPQ